MAAATIDQAERGIWRMLLLFLLLLVSLYFMSDATHNSEKFGQLYSILLLTNGIGLVVLTMLIGTNLFWLVRQYRMGAAGSRLTARLVAMFVMLAVAPVSVVYYFSVQSLKEGIDSWFDVQIEESLEDALKLSRSAFEIRLRDQLHLTEKLAEELTEVPTPMAPLNLLDLRVRSGADELTLIASTGRIIASSSIQATDIVPNRPSDTVLAQVRRGQAYVGLDPVHDEELFVRAVVPVPMSTPVGEQRMLQALYAIPERFSSKAERVETAYSRYKELAFLRKPLKQSYILTLSVVLLLSLLSAVWAAFYSARKLVEPIRDLAEGTRAVAEGDYDKQLPVSGHDELGFLVKSFNAMTRHLSMARDDARRSQQQIEGQRAYLEALLGSLSSGVAGFAADLRLRTVNGAASRILGVNLQDFINDPLDELVRSHAFLQPLLDAIHTHHKESHRQWTEEVTLFGAHGRQVLICRGTSLADDHRQTGMVIVFDDVTALIQAQRDAAWGEVARRLAHEIKNPLTPIQLSAERLRRKILKNLAADDAEVLDRSTHTIVQQVEAMKAMVNAFSEYARSPKMVIEALDLNHIVLEVLDLYRETHRKTVIEVNLDTGTPVVEVDAGRMRQLLHNLMKNALEAVAERPDGRIRVSTESEPSVTGGWAEICVEDNGPGFDEGVYQQLFEPYVTTKPKGTGLGLAIVKKIVEEHSGAIRAENRPEGGARVAIRLQMKSPGFTGTTDAPF